MPCMYITTADGSYDITFDHKPVQADEAKLLFEEAVNEFGEFVEMSCSAQRLVDMDFDVNALKQFYQDDEVTTIGS